MARKKFEEDIPLDETLETETTTMIQPEDSAYLTAPDSPVSDDTEESMNADTVETLEEEGNPYAGEIDAESPEMAADDSVQDSEEIPQETPAEAEQNSVELSEETEDMDAAIPVEDRNFYQLDSPPTALGVSAKRSVKKTIYDLDINRLDRNLSPAERQEWNSIYASFRSRSILTGMVIGMDQNSFEVENHDTGELTTIVLNSLIVINHRVKILIPETEVWYTKDERPSQVARNMIGSTINYVILEIDREGQCAVGSRRQALSAKRHRFSRSEHQAGELLSCQVMAVGAKQCTVECSGYDILLTPRDMSYTAIPDLREKYRPGQELTCRLLEYDRHEDKLLISVKEAGFNPFEGADTRHPVGSRRQAVITGKYRGGIFCTLPDETMCHCTYTSQHSDANFHIGDTVIIAINQFNYDKEQIFGRILSKW